MVEAIVILVFIIAFTLVWYGLMYLIKHPDINISLEAKVLAHEPNLIEYQNKVMTYLHNEERASVEEFESLLGSEEIAHDVLIHLEKRGLIDIVEDSNGDIIITKQAYKHE